MESGSEVLILLCGKFFTGGNCLVLQEVDTKLRGGEGTEKTYERIGILTRQIEVESSDEPSTGESSSDETSDDEALNGATSNHGAWGGQLPTDEILNAEASDEEGSDGEVSSYDASSDVESTDMPPNAEAFNDDRESCEVPSDEASSDVATTAVEAPNEASHGERSTGASDWMRKRERETDEEHQGRISFFKLFLKSAKWRTLTIV